MELVKGRCSETNVFLAHRKILYMSMWRISSRNNEIEVNLYNLFCIYIFLFGFKVFIILLLSYPIKIIKLIQQYLRRYIMGYYAIKNYTQLVPLVLTSIYLLRYFLRQWHFFYRIHRYKEYSYFIFLLNLNISVKN